jgi:flagellin-like protein
MQLKELFDDDEAVSPVIGVILMVAITVILAAVIASFVLGLGDQTQNTAPQASFAFDYDASVGGSSSGVLTITHDGGDTISASELYVRGDSITNVGAGSDIQSSGGDWTVSGSSEVSAGTSVTVGVNDDYTVRVVYEGASGDSSATLGQDSGPEA